MTDGSMLRATSAEAAKAAPAVTISAYAALSAHLPEAVGLATLAYIILQAGYLLWRWGCKINDRNRALREGLDPPPVGEDAS